MGWERQEGRQRRRGERGREIDTHIYILRQTQRKKTIRRQTEKN